MAGFNLGNVLATTAPTTFESSVTPELDALAEQEALTQSNISTVSRTAGGSGTGERGGFRGASRGGAVEGKVLGESPATGGVESVMGGTLPEEGMYSDGTSVTYDPFAPPINGSSQDIQRWFDQFTPGTRDFATAEDSLNYQMGTGKYAPGEGLVWDASSQSYITEPNYKAPGGPTSDLGEVTQTGTDSFSVGKPGSTIGGTSGGGSGSDVDLGADMEALIKQMGDDSNAAAQLAADNIQALTDRMESMASDSARSMSIMMGVLSSRREEDEGRGSFTYNALGGN